MPAWQNRWGVSWCFLRQTVMILFLLMADYIFSVSLLELLVVLQCCASSFRHPSVQIQKKASPIRPSVCPITDNHFNHSSNSRHGIRHSVTTVLAIIHYTHIFMLVIYATSLCLLSLAVFYSLYPLFVLTACHLPSHLFPLALLAALCLCQVCVR